MTCCLCGQENARGHHCISQGCEQWICESCADGCAMCEPCFVRTRKEMKS